MDYGVFGVNCDLCGQDANHRTENCVALFFQRRPEVRHETLQQSCEFNRTDPEFMALIARAEADEARWAEMAAERRRVLDELQKHYRPGVRRHGTLTVLRAASLEEMTSFLQRLPDVNDISVGAMDTGGFRLEIFQGAHPQALLAS